MANKVDPKKIIGICGLIFANLLLWDAVHTNGSRGALRMKIGNIKHCLTLSVARRMADAGSDSALGRFAGATVDQASPGQI